ncbi:MAG: tRNA (adenosine(37)-N6)-threonylcarbamoyltransferase complex dimerization subunit type 1 TsaB [Gemmatimonadota bacterium]|jgi:tRNA threonylcarbamoyladenosine biosynthesis protein TsaB
MSGGFYLAMDTSNRQGSVAMGRGRPGEKVEILAQAILNSEEDHAAFLATRVGGLLGEVGVEPGDLSGIVVGAGPGSFTGVRVAAATAKAMAWALQTPLWAYSSLAGAAAGVAEELVRPRLVLFDARGDRVYAAAFRVLADSLETLVSPRATTVGEVLDGLIPPGALLMGGGATRHRDLLEGAGHRILSPPAGWPSAEGLLRLLVLDPGQGRVADRSRWEPDYLREAGAERMWRLRKEWKAR